MKTHLAVIISLILVGCGGSGGNGTVDKLTVNPSQVMVGQLTKVALSFQVPTYLSGYDHDGDPEYLSDSFGLTVVVPPGFTVAENTVKLTDDALGDVLFGKPDAIHPSRMGACPNGSEYLQFDFSSNYFTSLGLLDQLFIALSFKMKAEPGARSANIEGGTSTFLTPDPCSVIPQDSQLISVVK